MSDDAPATFDVEHVAELLKLPPDEVLALVDAGALEAAPDDPTRITQVSALTYAMDRARASIASITAPPKRSIVVDVLVPVLLVLGLLTTFVEAFSIGDGAAIVPVPMFVIGVAVGIAAIRALASRQDGFHATNGFGVTLYGDRRTAQGRIGTSFVVVVGVPIVPLRSWVILEKGDEHQNWSGAIRGREYLLRPLPSLHWAQAAPYLIGGWTLLLAAFALMTTID